ncbi:hypothetical protein CVT91_00200 [Candidatus Atribacteria bacterium HGW-Atribacteria-1]|nr:MAG: hypothetical protein CVT91_00200 [Candidatus Atribacteria bacterium HGW-Atribacteria-1]
MKQEETKPNTVYYTTNFETLLEVVNKIDEIKNNDLYKPDFAKRLAIYVTNKSGLILVSFGEDKKLNGCMVISRHIDNFGQYAWIDFAWIDKHCNYLRQAFYEEVDILARAFKIKRIQMRMSRGYKAMERLYGTREIARILEKEVI